MRDDLRALLEGIAYGDDPKITPGDRLRAAEQMLQLEDEAGGALLREVLALSADAVQAEYDLYVAQHELPRLVHGGAVDQRWPMCALALQLAVEERAEVRARELADADRLEREVAERGEAAVRAARVPCRHGRHGPDTTCRG